MAITNPRKPTLMSELREVKTLIQTTTDALRKQRDMLKTRGMNLPAMVMQAISKLNKDIGVLETIIINEQAELGQLRSMRDMASMINSSLDLDVVLNRAMDIVISLTDAERGYIILADPDTGELVFRVARENEMASLQGGGDNNGTPQISQTVLMEVLETGEPLLADNAYKDEKFQNNLSIASMTLRSVLCVPLKYKDEITGVVYVDNRLRQGVFQETEKNLLAAFANQAAIAIENARLYASIQTAVDEIRDIKELMDNVLASIGSGVITTDHQHNVQTFNRAASEILKKTDHDTIGKQIHNVLPDVSVNLDNHLKKIREADAAQVMEAEIEVDEGDVARRVALSMKFSALKDDKQNVQGVALVLDDLTEQRAREQSLSMVKRYLPPAMVENIEQIASLAMGGERREVTSMFVDVRSITTFPSDFRPRDIMEQLNIYFGKATEVIHKWNGIIDKYMGNEIMALYNTQLNPMEDHALVAVQTALDIRNVFLKLYRELGIDPDPHYYRIGMHTGVATLGNVGSLNRREFSAIGNTINTSKRFEENSKYGYIVISPQTLEHLKQSIDLETTDIRIEAGELVKLKGIENQVQFYEVFRP